MLSALRPRGTPVFAFTESDQIFRHMLLLWGHRAIQGRVSVKIQMRRSTAPLVSSRRRAGSHKKSHLVVVTNVLVKDRVIDTIQLRTVD